jgi:hypothetical protein
MLEQASVLCGVAVAAMVLWIGPAHACDTAPNCTISEASAAFPGGFESLPDCLLVDRDSTSGWGSAEEACRLRIENQCEGAVTFTELDCGEACAAPIVVLPGDSADVLPSVPTADGEFEQRSKWTIDNGEDGVLDLLIEYSSHGDACAGHGPGGCSVAPPVSAKSNEAALMLLVLICVARRRHCTH